MDEKTEELRDIFLDVTEADTVTETQEETPGALASEAEVDRRLAAAVADVRADRGLETPLSDEELVAVVRGFYAGDDDEAIAADLDAGPETVADARLGLHLVSDDDVRVDALRDADDRLDALREYDDDELAAALDADDAVAWHRRVRDAHVERRRVNDRYRTEFESILQDRDIAERMTENVQQDGLAEATEGMETDLQM